MTAGAWSTTPPFSEEPKDRWLRLTWAAKHFKIDHATLRGWCKTGVVAARQKPSSGDWLVSEQSLRNHLFGSTDVSA